MAETPLEEPIYSYSLEDYIDIGDGSSSKYVKATNMLTWDVTSDVNEYEAECIDYKTAKKFVQSRTCSIEVEQIAMRNNEVASWFFDHENDFDVPTKIVRVKRWTESEGKCEAKMAAFKFNASEPVKEFNSPLKLGGTFERSDDGWTPGEFDLETKAFTAGASGGPVG